MGELNSTYEAKRLHEASLRILTALLSNEFYTEAKFKDYKNDNKAVAKTTVGDAVALAKLLDEEVAKETEHKLNGPVLPKPTKGESWMPDGQ